MRVLAIDPGFDRVGVAVLDGASGKEVVLFSSCIQTNKKDSFAKRLNSIEEDLRGVISEWKPNILAIETLFFSKNRKTALQVAEARGVIVETCSSLGLSVHEYNPAQIKIAVTGSGNATKDQVAKMVYTLLSLEKENVLDDEMDAIALGITHLASVRE